MISKWLNKIDQLNPKLFFWWIVACSILLAAWMQTIQHGWINPDSVLYLEQARLFTIGDWQGILQVYKWPLYGIAIGATHQLTQLPIHTAAQLLNMLFFGLATASFLQIIKLAGGNNRTWFMGALLLFSSQYIVGDVLEMLMRDEGFWAFYLSALVFFIRYSQKHMMTDAILWQLCIIFATLFRIEAILFLLLLPLSLLLKQHDSTIKRKLQSLLSTYSVSLVLGVGITVAVLTQPQLSISHFGRLNEIFSGSLYQQFTQKLITQADIMANLVLGGYLDEFAIPGLLLTFLYVLGSKTLTAAGLVGSGLAALSIKHSETGIQPTVKRILIAVSIIAFISMMLIIIKVFVLSSRYVVALAWILLVFASFYLTSLSSSTNKKIRVIFLVLCLILTLGIIKNILPKRDGYNYSQEAVAWINTHNKSNEPIFYNETRIRYYANQPFIGKWSDNMKILTNSIDNQNILQYRYLLIVSSDKETKNLKLNMERIPQYKLIKTFKNYKHKKFVKIFKKS